MTAPIRAVPPPDVPEIKVGTDLGRMVNEAITALARHDPGIYQRSGELVHVVSSVEPPKLREGKIQRDPGVPLIRPLALPTLKERLSTSARWIKWNGKSKTFAPALPHDAACKAVHARGEWGGLRAIVGVTTAPTFRSDGSVLQTRGFDASTGLLYWPNAAYHTVPEEPTRDDAHECYRMLCAATEMGDGGFPFAEPHHKAAWVCSVLSILARPAIDGPVPLFAIDANTRGVGKSILADAAIRIALGHAAARMSLPETDDEMRKRISTLVLDGDQTALIDNVTTKLGGQSIETAMTTSVWKDRVLGSNGSVTAPMLLVWFATGNNMQFSSDMRTRAVLIRLESPLENPESRPMPNLFAWIAEKRHHLVTWALTILRAWHVAGRPRNTKVIGRFDAWGSLIPPAVEWASGIDPTHAFAADDPEADDERMAIAAILACVEHLATPHITAKQIITALYGGGDRHDGTTTPDHHPSYGAAREAIEGITHTKPGQTPAPQRLGKYFDRIKGRVVGGRHLARGPVTHGMATWTIRKGG